MLCTPSTPFKSFTPFMPCTPRARPQREMCIAHTLHRHFWCSQSYLCLAHSTISHVPALLSGGI
jgi:hypothetical protein